MSSPLLVPQTGIASSLSAFSPPGIPDIAPARDATATAGPGLPSVAPGQLWLAELLPGASPTAAERHLLRSADIVIYDRALAASITAVLPLGAYAEPAPADGRDPAAIDRGVRFALDGWRVLRLVDGGVPRSGRGTRLRAIAARLRAGDAGPAARIFSDRGGEGVSLGDAGAADSGDGWLIVVFDASGRVPSPPVAVAANGLAG